MRHRCHGLREEHSEHGVGAHEGSGKEQPLWFVGSMGKTGGAMGDRAAEEDAVITREAGLDIKELGFS